MIEATRLTKKFGTITAIKNVSFHVDKGEILGFLGPNGAGKTTTIRILTGLFPATSGSARIAGFDVFDQSLEVRRRLGYLPENVPIYNEMPVSAYLKFAASMKGVEAKNVSKEVARVLDRCSLIPVKNRIIGKLSKGFRQRVGIAQAILRNPDVLILDEPTIGLDPRQITDIRKLIMGFAGRKTVVLSSHILPEVSMMCRRVAIINNGRIVAIDTPQRLTGRTADKVLLEVKGPATEILARLRGIPGVESISSEIDQKTGISRYTVEAKDGKEIRGTLSRSIITAGWSLLEMRAVRPSLEDVFIRLTREER
ncbi:MAG: ABC transporter ATP-binding protein [Pseudomonadota bacterium]